MATAGWAGMRREGALARWRALCEADAALARHLPGAEGRFAIEQEGLRLVLRFAEGRATVEEGGEAGTAFAAPAATWARFLEPVPPRHHHNLFAMRMRVPEFGATGDELAWAQHCHLLRRALDLGRWILRGESGPAPASLRPSLGTPAPPCPPACGRYVTVRAGGRDVVLYGESSANGRSPILGLHTAGSDGRQFHRLMSEPRLAAAGWSVTTFDMPGHGRSPPIAEPGAWALTTDLYAELVLGFRDAWSFAEKPVLLGASMSGEIALEIAFRAPERFAAIVACEAADHIAGRRTPFAHHPRVNAAVFTPEWVEGLMAPHSPAECAAEVWWHYSQGGAGTFPGDIVFYSGGWDARDRVHRIDTSRCPLWMLTGEYDFSCTAEHSAETAARIPGARFGRMAGIGHFPFAENPALFLDHLLLAPLDAGRA
ncbi:alpha/beta fold hydrolase [Craurococcus roseus]|uniref:alpha/beta fold hydrolase n=1 Tax=Craurococcus roseus TaxID=77585 RepID=UPI0031D5018C